MNRIRIKTRSELPAAVYAAAGAGDMAYQQLRRLPEVTARTLRSASQTADALRQRVGNGDRELNRVRSQFQESARRSAEALSARATTAQERAATSYRNLVARGEQVMSDRFGVATGHAESPTKAEIVVDDPGQPGPAGAVTAGRSGAATGASPSAAATANDRAGSGTTGTSAVGPNARGVAKNGTKAAAKRAAT